MRYNLNCTAATKGVCHCFQLKLVFIHKSLACWSFAVILKVCEKIKVMKRKWNCLCKVVLTAMSPDITSQGILNYTALLYSLLSQ